MPVVPFSPVAPSAPKPVDPAQEPWLLMAAAQMDAQGRLIEKPLDITSQAHKADRQKSATTWPEGTDPEVRRTFDKSLKDGTITKDQYNKAMRDPRQFVDQ